MTAITTAHISKLIDKLAEQQDISRELLEALKMARSYIAFPAQFHDPHCAHICNKGGPCDCPVPTIDAAIAKAEVSQ